jgi:hypothetical protein
MALGLTVVKYGMRNVRVGRLLRRHPCFCQSLRFASQERASKRVREIPVTGASGSTKETIYSFQPDSKKWTKVSSVEGDKRNKGKEVAEIPFTDSIYKNTLKHLLPNGYPNSVHAGYTRYTIYSFLGNLASTTTMVLSTQTLLLAIGVGQHAAAPISATLNWILKDGIGQFGGILFASRISSSSNSVDADPKRWRMVSSLSMDFAMMLELATPAFPGYFLFIASVANIGKNIAFLTASASRAKLHQCLSQNENLADITAKAGSQSILASLLGTGIGIGLSPYLLDDLSSVVLGCLALSGVNQIFTYQSLKHVPIDRLNRHRLMILFDLYFKGLNSSPQADASVSVSPEEVCKHESFLPLLGKEDSHNWLHVGCGIETLAPNGPKEILVLHQNEEKYLLNCQIDENELAGRFAIKSATVTFLEDACDEDILRGVFHAYTMRTFADSQINFDVDSHDEPFHQKISMVSSSHGYMNEHFPEFKEMLSKTGWKIDDGISIVLESEKDVRIRL